MAYASDAAEGVLWAVEHGATVINMSLAGTARSSWPAGTGTVAATLSPTLRPTTT